MITLFLAKLFAKSAVRTNLYSPTVALLAIYFVPVITNFIKLGIYPINLTEAIFSGWFSYISGN